MIKTVKQISKNILITFFMLSAATVLGFLFSHWKFQETNIVVTYLLSVLLISRSTNGYFYGILGTVSSLILFNWFFTAPYCSLKVNDPTYSITFIVMSITAVITSASTSKIKQAAQESKEKEAESNALYKMTNLLTDAEDTVSIMSIAVNTVSDIILCDAAMICFNEEGEPQKTFIQQKGKKQIHRELQNGEELKNRIEKLHTPYEIDSEYFNYPIYGRTMTLGILRIPKETGYNLTEKQSRTVYSIIESTALALERLNSIRAQVKSHEEAVQEHYRGNLLRAISHDIRTPLSGIMGSVEMLMGMTDKKDPRYEIAQGVYQDADWLHSLVENILNLTKIHDGHLNIAKQPEAVEEVVSAAVMVMEKRCPGRNIDVNIPEKLIMVPMDAKLISQVIINLMDNANKHTPPEKEIGITVTELEKSIRFSVYDRGSGIEESDLPNIFQMFYTTRQKSPDSQKGIGLGLSICQSIVEAHGGKISAENREGGGAEFTFILPLEGEKNNGTR